MLLGLFGWVVLGLGQSRPSTTATLLAVGDVSLARGISYEISLHGKRYPFERVSSMIKGADISVFNLECVLSNRGRPEHLKYLLRADPKLAPVLSASGLSVAVLANNHALDCGSLGLQDTIHEVRSAGLNPVGYTARPFAIVRMKGLRIGILALNDVLSSGPDAAGRISVTRVDEQLLPAQVRAARAQCDALILFFHWGEEYMKHPTERQQRLAHLCIDNGADLVLGCHPHVLQTIEDYKGKTVVYSMGGFVFDDRLFGSDHSAMFFFRVGRQSAKLVRTVPIVIRNGQPVPEGGKEWRR